MRRADVGIAAHPTMPIAAADPARLYRDNDPVRFTNGLRNIHNGYGLLEIVVDSCSHKGCNYTVPAQLTADDADGADKMRICAFKELSSLTKVVNPRRLPLIEIVRAHPFYISLQGPQKNFRLNHQTPRQNTRKRKLDYQHIKR
jgi:hypothetical protein